MRLTRSLPSLAWALTWLSFPLACFAGDLAPRALLLCSDDARIAADYCVRALGWTMILPASDLPADGASTVTLRLPGGDEVQTTPIPAHIPGKAATRWAPVFHTTGTRPEEMAATRPEATLHVDTRHWIGRDPTGALVAFAGPKSASPLETQVRPALWPVLFTADPTAAIEFYGATLGWTASPEPRTPLFNADYRWSRDGRALAALTYHAGGRAPKGLSSGWLPLFGVADIDSAVREAWRAGGRILRPAGIDLIGGRVAVLADPDGAVFGLYELIPTSGGAPATRSTFQINSLTP